MTSVNWFLTVCGISHKTSSIEQREPLQLGHDQIAKANAIFSNLPGVMESVIVSTCNRVEFYFVSNGSESPFETVKLFYKEYKDIDISNLADNFYTKKGSHTASHLFKVSAGMDSMVFGESQILGQVKDAYSSACSVRAVGKIIHRLFHQAFRVGKQVRTDTEMGKGACSVSSAAVALLRDNIGESDTPSILFIGINQMIALAASGLRKIENARFIFANRKVEKAIEFAARYNAEGHPLGKLANLIPEADIIVSCTGSELPIITEKLMDDIIVTRAGRFGADNKKLIIMDMAVPRDVEIDKSYNPAITVFDLEDIHEYVNSQQSRKEAEIPKAQEIVDRRLGEFNYWFDHVRHEPIYNGLDGAFEAIRSQEMSGILKKLTPELRDDVDKITKRMVNRLLQIKVRTSGKE
jgi:glutamyl-tRNA reductase